jgi:hypothetical protein
LTLSRTPAAFRAFCLDIVHAGSEAIMTAVQRVYTRHRLSDAGRKLLPTGVNIDGIGAWRPGRGERRRLLKHCSSS